MFILCNLINKVNLKSKDQVPLYFFIAQGTTQITDHGPFHLRATRMHDSILQYGLFPGDEIKIMTQAIENNGLTFTGVGQIVKGDQICVAVIGEYYIVD